MFQRLFRWAGRRLPGSRLMKNMPGTNSTISTSTAWPTPRKCRTGHRRFTESRILPVGLAAWMLDHDIRSYGMISGVFDGKTEGLTRDDVLDNVTLYWLTNTAISSARLYWDTAQISTGGGFFDVRGVTLPGRRERLPRRNLCGPAKLGRAGVSKTHLLQQARQGRALRSLGTACSCSAPRCVQHSEPLRQSI